MMMTPFLCCPPFLLEMILPIILMDIKVFLPCRYFLDVHGAENIGSVVNKHIVRPLNTFFTAQHTPTPKSSLLLQHQYPTLLHSLPNENNTVFQYNSNWRAQFDSLQQRWFEENTWYLFREGLSS